MDSQKNYNGGFKMNKSDLIQAVVEKTGLTKKESTKALEAVIDAISESLAKGDKVQLVGFGTFEVRSRKAREGRNPATGETIKIEASKAPAFKAGKALKDKVK
jgi:DNA-binding protein HU-beta